MPLCTVPCLRGGCSTASDEVIQVADKLGAGVAKALLGKAAVPDDLPYVTGSIGFSALRRTSRSSRRRPTISALIKRDPDSLRMVTASAKEWWDGVRPR